jgi:hypothetical protein
MTYIKMFTDKNVFTFEHFPITSYFKNNSYMLLRCYLVMPMLVNILPEKYLLTTIFMTVLGASVA